MDMSITGKTLFRLNLLLALVLLVLAGPISMAYGQSKDSSDIDYSRVMFNVSVSKMKILSRNDERLLQQFVSDLKTWYATSFCGMDMEMVNASGSKLKEEAENKDNCGYILQVMVTDVTGDYWDLEFSVTHGMLMKVGKTWKPVFQGKMRGVPHYMLSGRGSYSLGYNPAEKPFVQAMLPVVVSSVKRNGGDNAVAVTASIKNNLPYAVKNMRIRFPYSEASSNNLRSFTVDGGITIEPGASKVVTATGNANGIERDKRLAIVEFGVSDKSKKDDKKKGSDQGAPAKETPATPPPADKPDDAGEPAGHGRRSQEPTEE
jgi:hypothetical protein